MERAGQDARPGAIRGFRPLPVHATHRVRCVLCEAAVSLSAQWHHANIDLPDTVESKLKHFIVTPRYHAMHHMVDRSHGDAYFSTVFSIWDVIWKTTGNYQTRDEMRDVALGLPDGRETGQSSK